VAATIEKFQEQLAAGAEHPLCGRPAVCVTMIEGGVGINTVPDRATISIDRRIGPGESPLDAYAQLIAYIAEHTDKGDAKIEHDPPFMKSHGLSDAHNGTVARWLVELVSRQGRPSKTCGAPYGTDGAAIGVVGVPTVVFGPGSVRQAHTADGFIDVAELKLGTDLFERIANEGLRGD
jgi:acetylornithine deacetylase